MSDIDLTEARGVARVAYEKAYFAGLPAVEARAAALDAALPHIERQVREQVAREITAEVIPVTSAHSQTQTAHNRALEFAARIARGEKS